MTVEYLYKNLFLKYCAILILNIGYTSQLLDDLSKPVRDTIFSLVILGHISCMSYNIYIQCITT